MKYSKKIVSAESMMVFGKKVGQVLEGGECFVLIGDVGAGKTTFTKGLALGLGVLEPIQSPTFTVNRLYEARDSLKLSHYDFYRLNDAGIMANELAEAQEDGSAVIVIEWADVVSEVSPKDRIEVNITSPSESKRDIAMKAYGSKSQRVLERISI